ncbi:MAG: sarcosine oxidase subunit gamma family protein [Candidatus Limnocylindrales bacterium]
MAQVDLRADPADIALQARLAAVLTVAPPIDANTVAAAADGQGHVLWLGPDEWLVVGREGAGDEVGPAIAAALQGAAEGAFVTTVDVSANRVGVEVEGTSARDLLAFGCALDLAARIFGPGCCAQTMVARAGVVLWLRDEDPSPRFWLLVRPSFATYLEMWLRDAEVGLG